MRPQAHALSYGMSSMWRWLRADVEMAACGGVSGRVQCYGALMQSIFLGVGLSWWRVIFLWLNLIRMGAGFMRSRSADRINIVIVQIELCADSKKNKSAQTKTCPPQRVF